MRHQAPGCKAPCQAADASDKAPGAQARARANANSRARTRVHVRANAKARGRAQTPARARARVLGLVRSSGAACALPGVDVKARSCFSGKEMQQVEEEREPSKKSNLQLQRI